MAGYLFWNFPQMNVTKPYSPNGSVNGVVPSSSKPLPELMLAQILSLCGVISRRWFTVSGKFLELLIAKYAEKTWNQNYIYHIMFSGSALLGAKTTWKTSNEQYISCIYTELIFEVFFAIIIFLWCVSLFSASWLFCNTFPAKCIDKHWVPALLYNVYIITAFLVYGV